jgi:hypothetical protein
MNRFFNNGWFTFRDTGAETSQSKDHGAGL